MNLRKFKKGLKKEYQKTFENNEVKYRFTFKLRHAFAILLLLLGSFLLIEHFGVSSYNKKIDKEKEEQSKLTETTLIKIESKEEYKKIVSIKQKKASILSTIISGFKVKDAIMEMEQAPNMQTGDEFVDVEEAIPESGKEQINTNVQTSGIDEADYSKCDGTYIYSLNNNNFIIFDLNGNKIVDVEVDSSIYNLFIYKNKIILLGHNATIIYNFDGEKINQSGYFRYAYYKDSRLMDENFYLVFHNNFNEDKDCGNDLYYDGLSEAKSVYSIIKFNLETDEFKLVNNLNSGNVNLYMSKNHIYLATTIYPSIAMTVISVFDTNLNPFGVFKVEGTVLNQFSMDEYNEYFRVVTTDRYAEERKLNAISIFSLKDKKLVGYLNEGIGLGRQIVKSVRFKDNTCYVVTYLNTDPLYEIDLSNPANPTIISEYQSPGYSSYLHTFTVKGEEYVFGIGYCDDLWTRKISVYKNDEQTTQIGTDFLINDYYQADEENSILVNQTNHVALNDHKALFIYQYEDILYIGVKASTTEYYFFKIDVSATDVISVYQKIELEKEFLYSRCYLINEKIYITNEDVLYITDIKKK